MNILKRLAVVVVALAGASVAQADPIFVTVTGTIYDLADPTDHLGYGGLGDGHRVTIYFMYDTDTAAPDYYGGARFPVEADYFTQGNSSTAPSWMSSFIVFDNGDTYSPDDYTGATVTTDQVKIIERDAGSPFDYFSVHDESFDATGGGILGSLIYEYVDNLVNGISIEQFPIWTTTGTLGSRPEGVFNFRDLNEDWKFTGYVLIDSLTVYGDKQIVTIDIKPGSYPNAVNPDARGFLPVAILTEADFDALRVDYTTVEFGPAAATPAREAKAKDVDDDGDSDLIMHFKISDTGIACGDTAATLTGMTFDGEPITGTDSVKIVKCP